MHSIHHLYGTAHCIPVEAGRLFIGGNSQPMTMLVLRMISAPCTPGQVPENLRVFNRKRHPHRSPLIPDGSIRNIKGIVHPFELGGETTLIRSAVNMEEDGATVRM